VNGGTQIHNEQSFLHISYSHDQTLRSIDEEESNPHLYDQDASRQNISVIQEGEEFKSRHSSSEGEDYEGRRLSQADTNPLGDLEIRSSPSGSQYFHEVKPLALLQLLEEAPNVVTMEENITLFSIKVHEVEKPETADSGCLVEVQTESVGIQTDEVAQEIKSAEVGIEKMAT